MGGVGGAGCSRSEQLFNPVWLSSPQLCEEGARGKGAASGVNEGCSSRGHLAPELQSVRAVPARRPRSPRSPRLHPATQGRAHAAGGSRAPGGQTAGPQWREPGAGEARSPGRPEQPQLPAVLAAGRHCGEQAALFLQLAGTCRGLSSPASLPWRSSIAAGSAPSRWRPRRQRGPRTHRRSQTRGKDSWRAKLRFPCAANSGVCKICQTIEGFVFHLLGVREKLHGVSGKRKKHYKLWEWGTPSWK